MAYDYTVTGPIRDGDILWYEIVETEIGTSDEFELELPFASGHLVLIDSALTTAGSASSIQVEVGWLDSWTTDQEGHIVQAPAAAVQNRVPAYYNFWAQYSKLFVRSNPNTGTGASGVIKHRIGVRKGAA